MEAELNSDLWGLCNNQKTNPKMGGHEGDFNLTFKMVPNKLRHPQIEP